MLSGQGIEKTSKRIRDRFNVGKHYSERLVRTETNHFNNEADSMAYEEMGIDKYVFVATLDSRTSMMCQDMDNKVFDYKDREVGINFPPLHPNCRSKTRGYLGEEMEKQLKRRARNPITGQTEIIDNMSYKEWYNKNVKSYVKSEIDKSYKMVKNKSTDKKQYEDYKNRLINSPYLPRKLDKFIEIKYNNNDLYNRLKREYKTIGKINKSSDNITRDANTYYKFRNENIETTQHFIYDYHKRMYKNNGEIYYNFNKIIEMSNKSPNYYDEETNRNVRLYDKIILISEKNTNEMVSMRKGREKKLWKKI